MLIFFVQKGLFLLSYCLFSVFFAVLALKIYNPRTFFNLSELAPNLMAVSASALASSGR